LGGGFRSASTKETVAYKLDCHALRVEQVDTFDEELCQADSWVRGREWCRQTLEDDTEGAFAYFLAYPVVNSDDVLR
jgi:hypothetical protein